MMYSNIGLTCHETLPINLYNLVGVQPRGEDRLQRLIRIEAKSGSNPPADPILENGQEEAFKKALADRKKRFQAHQRFVYFG